MEIFRCELRSNSLPVIGRLHHSNNSIGDIDSGALPLAVTFHAFTVNTCPPFTITANYRNELLQNRERTGVPKRSARLVRRMRPGYGLTSRETIGEVNWA